MYKVDISDNTVPADYKDLKIIRKGEGQNDLKQFLSSFEQGSTGRGLGLKEGDVKLFDSAVDKNMLRSQVKYHKKFLDENTKLVHLKDTEGLKEAIETGRILPPRVDSGLNGGQFVMSLIEDPLEQQEALTELHLPENLVPMWKVYNELYQIYYIPGYDNWLYKGVKKDPESVHQLSKYKKKFFETLTKQSFNNTTNNFRIGNRAVGAKSTLARMKRPNSVQNYRTVNLNHSQFNETGFYPSGKQETQFSRTGNLPRPKDGKMKTGTEFWQTSYQAGITDPWKDCQRDLLIPSLNRKENKGDGQDEGSKQKRRINIGGRFDCPKKPKGKRLLSSMRANSTQGAWRKGPHKTQCRTQVTEYNFSYGKLGSNPRSIMPRNSNWKPFINDPLK